MFYFTPLPGFFSPFPHGTISLSVIQEYLALRGGPRRFTRDYTCPMLLGIKDGSLNFRIQDFHFLWLSIPAYSSNSRYTLFFSHNPQKLSLGCSHFARRYSGNRFYFLFL